jgi:glucose/arabinose dehydrogenase
MPADCFTVSVIVSEIAPVRRLLPLVDGRLLVLLEDGAITVLPSGTSERPEFATRGDAASVDVADVAADPDFQVNRFLYFATTSRGRDGRRRVSVVRARERADRVGESATIVADLPAAEDGDPVISIGPDRRLYLAMPGRADGRTGYSGHVLRFTREGGAAGNSRMGSPILAQGRGQPTRLAWDAGSRLLIASADSGPVPGLAVVPVEDGSVPWPAPPISVSDAATRPPNARLSDIAAAPAASNTETTLALIEDDPGVLFIATLTLANPLHIGSKSAITLPSLTPTAVAFASNGDLIVAVVRGMRPSGALLLRLKRLRSK